MNAVHTSQACDVVTTTSEDDAVTELCTRMERARQVAAAIRAEDPSEVLVHPARDGTCLLVRTRDPAHGLTIGTSMARRFDSDVPDRMSVPTLIDVVLAALDRYGTIDPRQAEYERRCAVVLDCVMSERKFLMPEIRPEQFLLVTACPWSEAAANVGGYDAGDNWREPTIELPKGCEAYLPQAVETSIDQDGTIRISARTTILMNPLPEIVDAMTRLRLHCEILHGGPMPQTRNRR